MGDVERRYAQPSHTTAFNGTPSSLQGLRLLTSKHIGTEDTVDADPTYPHPDSGTLNANTPKVVNRMNRGDLVVVCEPFYIYI